MAQTPHQTMNCGERNEVIQNFEFQTFLFISLKKKWLLNSIFIDFFSFLFFFYIYEYHLLK